VTVPEVFTCDDGDGHVVRFSTDDTDARFALSPDELRRLRDAANRELRG